jgi:hypothetical protein
MSFCDNPNSIQLIDLDECIGLSLATINNNFKTLKDQTCLDTEQLIRVQANFNTLYTNALSLSAKISQIPKAWVNFSGSEPSIISSYNVSQVIKIDNQVGSYSIKFITPFLNNKYAVIGTSKQSLQNGYYGWVQPTTFTTLSAGINIHSITDILANRVDPDYVSVVFFNN